MPAPPSADLRQRALDAARSATAGHVASRFGVSVSTVHRLRRLDRLHSSVESRPHAGSHALLLAAADRRLFDGLPGREPVDTPRQPLHSHGFAV